MLIWSGEYILRCTGGWFRTVQIDSSSALWWSALAGVYTLCRCYLVQISDLLKLCRKSGLWFDIFACTRRILRYLYK